MCSVLLLATMPLESSNLIRLFQVWHLIELTDVMDGVYCSGVYKVFSFTIGGVAEGSHEH